MDRQTTSQSQGFRCGSHSGVGGALAPDNGESTGDADADSDARIALLSHQARAKKSHKRYQSTHSAGFFLKKTHDVHQDHANVEDINCCDNNRQQQNRARTQNVMNNYKSFSEQDDDQDDQDFNDGRTHPDHNRSAKNRSASQSGGDGANPSPSLSSARTTDGQTMMHILKANIGTGVLAMPSAFKNVGLWLGFLLVPIIGSVCIHCMNILISSHNCLCDRFNFESLDYDQVAALSLACGPRWLRPMARRAQLIVTIFLLLTQMGFCCVYVMFVVENLQLALFNLFELDYSTSTYLFIIFPVIWLTSCTSNLNHLARISTLANVLQFTGLALILFDLLQFHTFANSPKSSPSIPTTLAAPILNTLFNTTSPNSTASESPPIIVADNTTQPTGDSTYHVDGKQVEIQVESWPGSWTSLANGLPLFFATAVYAFEGIGVVLPLIKEMRYPEHISGSSGVLVTGMRFVAILYMAIGFFGYSKYGQTVGGSITLNLPETSLNEVVRLCFALGIGLSYSLQFYVPWTIVWPWIDESLFYSYRPREENRDKKLNFQSKLEWGAAGDWPQTPIENDGQGQDQEAGDRNQVESLESPLSSDDIMGASHMSNASTFATSYMVQSHKFTSSSAGGLQLPISSKSVSLLPNDRLLRNRLEDVAEQDVEDHIPHLEWRPPPRSMRGKRKLVRYTTIFFGVSLTCK